MLNKFLYILLFFGSISLAAQVDYNKLDLKQLKQDLESCPKLEPGSGISCLELREVAQRINDLVVEMQLDRQGFGRLILDEQVQLAKQLELREQHGGTPDLDTKIENLQQNINERLAIIKWLESPKNRFS